MNCIDEQLGRLFRSAAQVQPRAVPAVPYGLETRVMAAWREAQTASSGFWDTTVLVRGLILAGVIMAISFVPALTGTSTTTTNPFSEYLQLTDSTVTSDGTL
jgi:hypothetical protein